MLYTLYLTATLVTAVASSLILQPLLSVSIRIGGAGLEASHGLFLVLLVVGGLLSVVRTGNSTPRQANPPARFSRPARPSLQGRFGAG